MSAAGISSSSFPSYDNQTTQNNLQRFQQEFQQLGQDLQSGNLSAAQSDFATLQQLGPQSNSTASAQSNNPVAQAFSQLSQDLQSGNLSAAQQDYSNIQQDTQNQPAQTQSHPHHHHHHASGNGNGEGSETGQLFTQLGQALQSGNLSAAQQAYNSLLQDLPVGQPGAQVEAQSPGASGVSVSA
jgi:outer membrane protein assembly factor BamD (BamD/ComL family)